MWAPEKLSLTILPSLSNMKLVAIQTEAKKREVEICLGRTNYVFDLKCSPLDTMAEECPTGTCYLELKFWL